MTGYAAVILAGGSGRRMAAERVKPMLPVNGRTMISRVLDAVADAGPRVVVGPAELDLPAGVIRVLERPPGGGPVAATAAGLAALGAPGESAPSVVALLAADLPLLTRAAVGQLLAALAWSAAASIDGALFIDQEGRRQVLCGVWHTAALRMRLAALSGGAGTSMRALLDGLRVGEVSVEPAGPPPWYDCDAPADLRRAERWL